MLSRRNLLQTAGVAALLSPLAACSGGSGGAAPAASPAASFDANTTATLTMTWWGNEDRADKYKQSLAAFNKKYPNITVQTQFQAFPDYWTARNTEAAGRALPDVFQMDLSYLRQFANNGQLLDLSPQTSANLDVSGVDEALLGSGTLEGKLYGVPTSTNTLAMFYHPDLVTKLGMSFPQEGYTWDDYAKFVEDGARAGAGQDPKLYSGGSPSGVLWLFIQWLVQKGIKPFNDDNTLGFNEGHVKEWLTKFDHLNADDIKFPPARAEQLKPKGGFTNNEVASEMSWDNFLSGYTKDSGDQKIEMVPIPSGEDGPKMFWKPSMLLSAGANTQQPDAAAALISFLINDPEVGKIFGTSKGVPAVKAQRDAMDIAPGSVDERVVAYEEEVAPLVTESAPLPVEGFGAIEAAWLRLAGDYGYNKITVDEWTEQWFQAVKENVPS